MRFKEQSSFQLHATLLSRERFILSRYARYLDCDFDLYISSHSVIFVYSPTGSRGGHISDVVTWNLATVSNSFPVSTSHISLLLNWYIIAKYPEQIFHLWDVSTTVYHISFITLVYVTKSYGTLHLLFYQYLVRRGLTLNHSRTLHYNKIIRFLKDVATIVYSFSFINLISVTRTCEAAQLLFDRVNVYIIAKFLEQISHRLTIFHLWNYCGTSDSVSHTVVVYRVKVYIIAKFSERITHSWDDTKWRNLG